MHLNYTNNTLQCRAAGNDTTWT